MSTQPEYGVILKPRVAFGSACSHHKSVHVQSPCTVVSCVGKTARFWDGSSGSSSFMHMSEGDIVSCLAVSISSSGKYCAVVQGSRQDICSDAEAATLFQVAIYNLKVQKLASTIRSDRSRAEPDSGMVMDFGMSGGMNKLLFVIWGPEDPILTVYRWYTGRAIGSARDCGIIRAAFEPATDMLLTISDRSIMTFSIIQESLQKSTILDLDDSCARFTCASFSMGYCIVGDNEGAVTILQYGDLISKLDATAAAGAGSRDQKGQAGEVHGCNLVDITPCGRGFVTVTQGGVMSLFTTGEHSSYTSGPFQLKAQHAVSFSRVAHIVSLSASATGDFVVLMSNLSDQYIINVAAVDENGQLDAIVGENPFEDKPGNYNRVGPCLMRPTSTRRRPDQYTWAVRWALAPFSLIQRGAHAGSILAMHAQEMGSLVATAGCDHTVRVYDASTGECIVVHTVMDDITALALHPVAPLLLVGMHASLCLFEVLLNKLSHAHEFGYPKTYPIAMSSAGHLFGAVVGGSFSIVVCDTVLGDVVARLKGHASTVNALSWTRDDRMLCSASVDGAVIFWNWQTRQRLQDFDYANKLQQFQSIFAMPTVGHVTLRAQSGLLCCIEHGELVKAASGPAGKMLGACLLGHGRILLVGDTAGNILCWPWHVKLGEPVPTQISAHSNGLLHMCTCAGQSMLVSASADGTMIVWDLQVIVAGVELPPQWRPPARTSYKVSKLALMHLQQKIHELGRNVMVAEAAAKAKAAIQIKELQDTVQHLESEISNLGQQLDEQEERSEKQRETLTEQFSAKRRALETMHMQACVQLETTYEKRFELEKATLKAHLAAKDDQHFRVEETLQRLREAHLEEVSKLQQRMKAQDQALTARCQKLEREREAAQEEFAEAVQQTEAEFDDNAERMKAQLERVKEDSRAAIEELNAQIHSYSRDNLRLKAEKLQDARMMTKQRKKIQDLESKLKNQCEKSLELQGALQDHQSMSAENHGLIDELQGKVSHLETVSFVMGERAKQFAEEVEPRRCEAIALTQQRSHQDKELARTLRMVASLKQAVNHKQEQLRHTKADAMGARKNAGAAHTRLSQIKADLAVAMQEDDDTLPNHKSKRTLALTVLEKKWNCSSGRAQHKEDDVTPDAAMRRQLLAVELKAGLAEFRASRLQHSKEAQNAQKVAENLQLLHENNTLRREIRQLQQASISAHAVEGNGPSMHRSEAVDTTATAHTTAGNSTTRDTVKNGAESAEDVMEDDGDDSDLDLAFSSLGSRVPPSRPHSSTALLRTYAPSVCSQSAPFSAGRCKPHYIHGRQRPQTAVGVVTTKAHELGSCQQRPMSARPMHSSTGNQTHTEQKRPVIRPGSFRSLSGHDCSLSEDRTTQLDSPSEHVNSQAREAEGGRTRAQQSRPGLTGGPLRHWPQVNGETNQLHGKSRWHRGTGQSDRGTTKYRMRGSQRRRPTSAAGVDVHTIRAGLASKPNENGASILPG